jgi:hypothetical protein
MPGGYAKMSHRVRTELQALSSVSIHKEPQNQKEQKIVWWKSCFISLKSHKFVLKDKRIFTYAIWHIKI